MSWKEVKKINSDMSIPLDKLFRDSISLVPDAEKTFRVFADNGIYSILLNQEYQTIAVKESKTGISGQVCLDFSSSLVLRSPSSRDIKIRIKIYINDILKYTSAWERKFLEKYTTSNPNVSQTYEFKNIPLSFSSNVHSPTNKSPS